MKFYVVWRLVNFADQPVQGFEERDTLAEAEDFVAYLRRQHPEPRWELEVNIIEGRLLLPEKP
jgi:hypothetical protein